MWVNCLVDNHQDITKLKKSTLPSLNFATKGRAITQ